MTDSHTIEIDGIGKILFERSSRARHIIISVRPGIGPRVAVPARISMKKAAEFALSRKDWIQKHLRIIQRNEKRTRALSDLYRRIDRDTARKQLKNRLSLLAGKHGFEYNTATVREQRTRWGSCSQSNNISLNLKLVLLPEDLIDYVMLHELVHTRIRNHGDEFWAELDRYVRHSRARARELRRNSLTVL